MYFDEKRRYIRYPSKIGDKASFVIELVICVTIDGYSHQGRPDTDMQRAIRRHHFVKEESY